MRSKFILILTLAPFLLLGQEQQDYCKLIDKINHYFEWYGSLYPNDGYLAISNFGLSEQERIALIEENNYDRILTRNKDSIQSEFMIYFYQDQIIDHLYQLVGHSEFQIKGLSKLTTEELSIVVSEDNKLFNFSFDEKTGGTYRTRISIMHYTDLVDVDLIQKKEFYSYFNSNGYNNIYNLNTDEGTKYVLTGDVRGCSYCFETFVCLVSFKDNKIIEDFKYLVNNRDWEDGVYYDHETKTINAAYHVDDLTPFCSCSQDKYEEASYNETETIFAYKCKCKFVFDVNNFKLKEESIEKSLGEWDYISELLSFKITENNKEVKLLTTNDENLYYVFLKPNGLVEFSFPYSSPYELSNFTLNESKNRLTFKNGNIVYQIYEIKGQSETLEIGVIVSIDDKKYDLKGDYNSLKGSLGKLDIDELHNVVNE